MSSVIGKKRVSFDILPEDVIVLRKNYQKVDQLPEYLYDILLLQLSQIKDIF
jgi:hypothetical protein